MTSPPQPAADADSAAFWAALGNGEIRLQFSPATGRYQFPPLERCRQTGGPLEWRTIGRGGRIVSFIVQHRPVTDGFADLLPYAIALVEPDEAPGVRLPMRIDGTHGAGVAVGGRVTIAIEAHPGGDAHVPVARLGDG